MKAMTTLFVMFILGYSAIGQTTINSDLQDLVSHNNRWHEVIYDYQGKAYSSRFTFSPDSTFLNGNWYFELLISFDEGGNTWEKINIYNREVDGKIYQIENNMEFLLYDFNLMVADTFTFTEPSSNEQIKLIVSNVDSILLADNTKRKRLYLKCENDPSGSWYGEQIWIEGIGDANGMQTVLQSCRADINSRLLCYHENDDIVFQPDEESMCWIITSTNDFEGYDIKVYPNPTDHNIQIEGIVGEFDYSIYSSDGKKQFLGRSNGEIDTNSLPSGLYLLELCVDGKRLILKVVKN